MILYNPRPASRRVPEKGRTTPLYFEGLKLAHLGAFVNLSMKPAGNFYSSDNGGKRVAERKKRTSQPEKIR